MIDYLKTEDRILRGKLPKRVDVTPAERARLVKVGKPLGSKIKDLITIVSPRTFARWASGETKSVGKRVAKHGRPRKTMAQLLATLGITKSHSRPHVSDDNPFSESQFKTIKYRPEFPDRFASIEEGLDFCGTFFHWQNHEHHHWGLDLLTPAMVHLGQADRVPAARQAVMTAAHLAHPERFVRRPPRPLALPREVRLNPPADGPEPRMLQLPRDTNFVPQLSQTD